MTYGKGSGIGYDMNTRKRVRVTDDSIAVELQKTRVRGWPKMPWTRTVREKNITEQGRIN